MRIGLVSYEYPPQSGLGGVGTYTFRLAGALGRAGHEVVVMAGPTEDEEIPQPNVTIHRIPARYHPDLPWRPARFFYWRIFARLMDIAHPLVWHWLRWDMAVGQAIEEIHRQTPLDVIEAPEHAANGLWVGRMRRWPMVVRTHGPWDLFYGINRTHGTAMNRILTYLERMSTRYAHVVTAPSLTMSAYIHERWRLDRPPTVAANFMDVPAERAPLPPNDGPQRIVCAGRLERFKGQDTLVQAFARVAGKFTRAELWLIGPDQWSTRESFSELVDRIVPEREVRGRIFLTGPQRLQQVQDQLRHARVSVICSSGFESFSLSTLEAMAAARPILGSRAGAVPELLGGGRCGLLASPGNVAQFAEALERLLGDYELCRHLSAAAHARAREKYDTQAALPGFLQAYGEAIEAFGR